MSVFTHLQQKDDYKTQIIGRLDEIFMMRPQTYQGCDQADAEISSTVKISGDDRSIPPLSTKNMISRAGSPSKPVQC